MADARRATGPTRHLTATMPMHTCIRIVALSLIAALAVPVAAGASTGSGPEGDPPTRLVCVQAAEGPWLAEADGDGGHDRHRRHHHRRGRAYVLVGERADATTFELIDHGKVVSLRNPTTGNHLAWSRGHRVKASPTPSIRTRWKLRSLDDGTTLFVTPRQAHYLSARHGHIGLRHSKKKATRWQLVDGPCQDGGDDTETPTTPAIAARLHNSDYAGFRWTPSEDNVGVAGYRVRLDGVVQAELPADASDHVVGDLTPSTDHVITLTAFDAAGNESAPSEWAFTTGARPTTGNEAVNLFWFESGYEASSFEVPFTVEQIGADSNLFFSQVVDFVGPASGYFGFQQKEGARIAWISFWSTDAAADIGQVVDYRGDFAANCERRPDEPGIVQPWACSIDIGWATGVTYALRLERVASTPADDAIGSLWRATITDRSTGTVTVLGEFLLAGPNGEVAHINDTVTFLEEFTVDPFCVTPPLVVLEVGNPVFDDGLGGATHDVTIPGPCSNGNSSPSDFYDTGGRRLSMGQ